MTKTTICNVGTITSYFADHAIITIKDDDKERRMVVTPQTAFAGAFDNEKTFASMRAGMTVNVFRNDINAAEVAYISPNLR